MSKKLSEMSLEELWRKFPIILTKYDPCRKSVYESEAVFLRGVLGQNARISHIGSTAVNTVWAKPIIDILAEVPFDSDMLELKERILSIGYLCMAQSQEGISFNKGYTENGFDKNVFHLHLRFWGDNDELYFRDYLLEHKDVAENYGKLKLELANRYKFNRDAYTNAKTDFIKKYTAQALKLYCGRYK